MHNGRCNRSENVCEGGVMRVPSAYLLDALLDERLSSMSTNQTKVMACSALPILYLHCVAKNKNFCASVLQHDTFDFIWNCCGDLNKNGWKTCQNGFSESLLICYWYYFVSKSVCLLFIYLNGTTSKFNYDILESIPMIRACWGTLCTKKVL